MSAATTKDAATADVFALAEEKARAMRQYLASEEALSKQHPELEKYAEEHGREWIRQMLRAHYELRGAAERPVRAVGSDRVIRTFRRPSSRPMLSIVGLLDVPRLAYQAHGVGGLHPMDAALNLPCGLYSHVVRRAAAERVACDAYEEVASAMTERTGVAIGKRQIEQIAASAAQDFDKFYAGRLAAEEKTKDLLVLTFDGKGVPMLRRDLRPATRAAAEATPPRLHTRKTKGEKRHRKRMAQVAAVYTVAPYVRTMGDVVADLQPVRDVARHRDRPRPSNKRVWASLTKPTAAVIRDAFEQARRRDPRFTRTWVVLVDGNRDQLKLVKKTARKLGVEVTILVDLIHVLEYVWKAAYAFHKEGTQEAEQWVQQRLMWLLQGEAAKVSENLRRNAKLESAAFKSVKKCLRYLRGVADYIAYDRALSAGLPIATGVIEGACRYLVKDRMERTGARWSLLGAEAVLRLRALRASGDFDAYWAFHLEREHERNHRRNYADGHVPSPLPALKPQLRRVK